MTSKRAYLVCALVAVALAESSVARADAAQGDTLKSVQQRGFLNCTSGDGNLDGFHQVDSKGKWHGVDIDQCRAIAVAIFGTDDKLKLVPISWAQRFPSLQSGDLDLVVKATGWNMSRDTELGVQFSNPYFVGSTAFIAHKNLNAEGLADIAGGTLCVTASTSMEVLANDYIREKKYDIKVVPFEKPIESNNAYFANRCDAIAAWGPSLASARTTSAIPDDHVFLNDKIALEPQAVAMRQGDDAWVDLVNWVIAATRIAEQNGVTSANVEEMRKNPPNTVVAKLLGLSPGIGTRLGLNDDWGYNVIKIVGNAAEIYDRNIGSGSVYKLPRGPNAPWEKGGVFFPPVLD